MLALDLAPYDQPHARLPRRTDSQYDHVGHCELTDLYADLGGDLNCQEAGLRLEPGEAWQVRTESHDSFASMRFRNGKVRRGCKTNIENHDKCVYHENSSTVQILADVHGMALGDTETM